jgi:hypothetical protein
MKLVVAVATIVTLAAPRLAHAISACGGSSGWSPGTAETLPPHARVVYWTDRPSRGPLGDIVATIDGRKVPTKTTALTSGRFRITVVEIDSDRTGALAIGWSVATDTATFRIAARSLPREVHADTARYHRKIPHTSVREVFDGLSLRLDTPAVLAHVKIRRDDKAAWTELDVPVFDRDFDDGRPTIRIGELGCHANYTPDLLEAGVDLAVEVTLPDGSSVAVKGIDHVVLPKLAKPTGTRPTDSD